MDLHDIVARLQQRSDPRLLVGFDTSDDAAVYLLADDLAVIQTADFITPIVDDPFEFGQIAAANSLSDIYAMGGKAVSALNLCCFPSEGIPKEDLRAILEGGLSKLAEAGALLVGGHTIRDKDLKYGMSVMGTARPSEITANRSAKPNQAIFLTKPIGTGVLATAAKKDAISQEVFRPAIESMKRLNRTAAEIMVACGATAATDITGFGLAVHLLEVARASHVAIEISLSEVPIFPGVVDLIRQGIKTGVTFSNEQAAGLQLTFDLKIAREDQLALFDPQTSGGLVIFIDEMKADELGRRLKGEGVGCWRIGSTKVGAPYLWVVS